MRHEPVLFAEVMEALRIQSGGTYIDCTIGDGGHAEGILERSDPDGVLIGLDADSESIARARKCLSAYTDRVHLMQGNFSDLERLTLGLGAEKVDGILIDLGWSSPQVEERGRGFSFLKDEPLDMRYDVRGQNLTAAEVVNERSVEDLDRMFSGYADERFSRSIAEAIVSVRRRKRIETTGELADIVNDVYRQKLRSLREVPWIGGMHPATRTFQAIRMAVNDELGVIERVIPQAVERLKDGGRLVMITFHSIEDRLVKHTFKKLAGKKTVRIITKKPITATTSECQRNPRARSAKLRTLEKI